MKEVTIYCDGCSLGNPGPSGWACILKYKDTERHISGTIAYATGNQAIVISAIHGFKSLKEPCYVTLYTNSKYLINGATGAFEQHVNQALFGELNDYIAEHKVTWIHISHKTYLTKENVSVLAKVAASKCCINLSDAEEVPDDKTYKEISEGCIQESLELY